MQTIIRENYATWVRYYERSLAECFELRKGNKYYYDHIGTILSRGSMPRGKAGCDPYGHTQYKAIYFNKNRYLSKGKILTLPPANLDRLVTIEVTLKGFEVQSLKLDGKDKYYRG